MSCGHGDGLGGPAEEEAGDAEIEKKLQRVDVEEHQEKHHAGEEAGGAVVEAVAAAVFVMPVPNECEKEEAEGEGGEAAHHGDEIRKGLRHIERDHQQSEGETENGVAESFEACDFAAALAKAVH